MKKPIVLTVTNQKGGVGKTTTAVNLASSFAKMNLKVLVIDLDYQANATQLLTNQDFDITIFEAIDDQTPLEKVIQKTEVKNLYLIPSKRELDDLRDQYVGRPEQFHLISDLLSHKIIKHFDFVVIDTHPSLDCFFQSAMVASDFYLIPMFAEADSSNGLSHQLQAVEKIKKYLNPNLQLLGCLITRFDKSNATHQRFYKLIKQTAKQWGIHIFKSTIPASNTVAAASACSLPLAVYKSSSPVAKAYFSFAKEVREKALKDIKKPKTKAQKAAKPAQKKQKITSVRSFDSDVAIDL